MAAPRFTQQIAKVTLYILVRAQCCIQTTAEDSAHENAQDTADNFLVTVGDGPATPIN
jgi:hypothetical protein